MRLPILLCTLIPFFSHAVTKQEMFDHINKVGENIAQEGNVIQFTFRGIPEIVVFDESADRMRIVSPITEVTNVDNGLLLNALEANYHSVLDARYAVSDDLVWSAFIHPLNDLSIDLLNSAINQVAIAHATFGQDFTSGALIFPGENR